MKEGHKRMHEYELTVRLAETDALGHVNNVSYFIYFEEGRVKFLEALGVVDPNKRELFNFILASAKCDFLQQAYFNQKLKMRTFVKKIGRSSFTLGQEVYCAEKGTKIASGETVMVYYDFNIQKSAPLPENLRSALENSIVPSKS